MRIRVKVLLWLLCLSLPAAFLPVAKAADAHETQTIMVYIVGSDLESEGGMATADIMEMLRAKPDAKRLNVLVMTGGTKAWRARTIPNDKLSVFKIEGASPKLMHQWDHASMGEASTLTAFLDYAHDAFPADSYGLVLWDHGGGPLVGFGSDTMYRGDALTLFELRQALLSSRFGKTPLEWLAFDACLMASLEVAALMSPYANYLLASEETLPGQGFNYRFLEDIAQGGLTGPEVARAIIERTFGFYEDWVARYPDSLAPVTLSVLDLGQANSVLAGLDGLFGNLDLGLEAGIYSDIARGRDRTKDYGRTTTTNQYDLIDLYDLARNMSGLYPDRASTLKAAISGMVLHSRSNAPNTNGLSIYFPLRNKEMYLRGWGQVYRDFDIAPAYRAFMGAFGEILMADSLSSWTGDEAPPVTFDALTGEYFIQLSAQQIQNFERAEYYVLAQLAGEEYLLNYMSSDTTLDSAGRLRANFNGQTMFLDEEGSNGPIIPYMRETENIDGVGSYQIPAVIERTLSGGEYQSVRAELLARIDKASQQAQLTGAIRSDEEGTYLGKRDLELIEWDRVYLVYNSSFLTRDGEGGILPLGDWVSSDVPKIASFDTKKGLQAHYDTLQEGLYEYFVLISIIDTQGNVYSSELMPLKTTAVQPDVVQPAPVRVTYEAGDTRALPLLEENALQIALAGITPPVDAVSGEHGALSMHFIISNELDAQRDVTLNWAAVNGVMLQVQAGAQLPPLGSAVMTLDIPADNLEALGIARAQDIRLRFELSSGPASVLSRRFTSLVQVSTNVEIGPALPASAPQTLTTLFSGEGITIAMSGEVREENGALIVPLTITNDSELFDMVQIAYSAVNGVMAPLSMAEDVLPGTVLHTQAAIPLLRTVLMPELAQYQYMFDGLDNLEALGITDPSTVMLRFALDMRSREGSMGLSAVRRLTPAVDIALAGSAAAAQVPDREGYELFNSEGVRVVRLAGDPTGKLFLIENNSPHTVHLSTFGRVKADGVNYGANVPLRATVTSGKRGYARLWGYIPGIEPRAQEISFQIELINLDNNTMLARSDTITIKVPGGQVAP